ncbi:PREDICTED: uncharacterized protein LOC108568661 [Nicrophorus vespilloides]|uniref:Uncharacterized protein LOC108568661 n=1 Tax=Nicrophorus vespilloides TaxID=110193 RepID=A0ABM1NEZ9_NICVS|nr:PREDICTED: uncharacterized protein LOC108568661 [Nicrophorus vespilloides]
MSRLRKAEKSGIIASLPVAIKSSSKDLSTWVSVVMEEELPNVKTQTLIKAKPKKRRSLKLLLSFLMQIEEFWRSILVISVILQFFSITYTHFIWKPKHFINNLFYVILLCEIIYFFNVVSGVLVPKIFKDRRIKHMQVACDVVLLLPFWQIYYVSTFKMDLVFIALRSLSLFRLYKVPIFFENCYKKLHKISSFILVEVLIYTGVLIQLTACFWYNYDNKPSNYLESLYYSYLSLFSYGGLMTSMKSISQITIGLGMLFCYLLLIYYASNMFLLSVAKKRRKYELLEEYRNMRKYCREEATMDQSFLSNLKEYYKQVWLSKLGAREVEVFYLAPNTIRANMLFDINLPALRRSLIFKNSSEAYFRHLATTMKHEFYIKGQMIYKQNELKNKMIIIITGVVEVLSEEDENSPLIAFGPGTCLGESSLLLTLRSKSSVMATTFVELQVLYREDFYATIPFYTKQYTKVFKYIRNRVHEARIRSTRNNRKLSSIKKIKESCMVDETSILKLYCLHKEHTFSRLIDAHSTLYRIWEMFIALLAVFVSISYPYYIAFERKFPQTLYIPSIFIEFLFVLDIPLILVTKTSRSETSLKKLISAKLNTFTFYIDLFAAFYFEYFAYLFENNDRYFYLFKLNRLLKFYRVVALLKKINGYEGLKSLFVCLVLIFWSSTAVYLGTCFNHICTDGGWYKLKMIQESGNQTAAPIFKERFLFSTYFALSYITRFEIHEIFLKNFIDILIVCALVAIAALMWGYCMGQIGAGCYLKLRRRLKFVQDVESIKALCAKTKMSLRLETRLLNYYYLQWEHRKSFDYQNNLHKSLEDELLREERINTLRTIPMFGENDEEFLKAVALRSKMYILPPGDIVTYYGSMNKEMFIIKEGYCVYKNCGGFYRRMGPNSVFGMCCLFFNLPEVLTVRTLTHCKLISIDGSALQISLNMFPEINRTIKSIYKEVIYNNARDFIEMPELTYFENDRPRSYFDWKKIINKASLVNVLHFCKKYSESYDYPFRNHDTLYLLKYILLPLTILPNGLVMFTWIFLRLLVCFLYAYLEPMQFILTPFHANFHLLMFALDFITYLDLYVLFHLCFYGDHNQLIFHPLRTAVNYANSSFTIDLLLCFPYEIALKIFLPSHDENHTIEAHQISPHFMHCSVRLVKILQVYKLFVAFNTWENNIYFKVIWVKILKFTCIYILLMNLLTCCLIVSSCEYVHSEHKHSTFDYNSMRLECEKQSWLNRSKYMNDNSFVDIYTTGIYWVTNMMVGLNFWDLMVQGGSNLILCIFTILVGNLFLGYTLATFMSFAINHDSTVIKYKKEVKDLKRFMEHEKVDKYLRRKLLKNVLYIWRRTKGINSIDMFSCLHTTLLQDTLSFLYEETLRQVPLFKGLDRSFLRIMSMIVKPQYFLEGQEIIRYEDIVDEFYILRRGTVEVELTRSELKMDLRRGSLFGYYCNETVPVMSIRATAITNADVLCIRTIDYYNILKNYTKFNYKIKDVMSEYKDFMPNKYCEANIDVVVYKRGNTVEKNPSFKMRKVEKIFKSLEHFYLISSYLSCLLVITQFCFRSRCMFFTTATIDLIFLMKFTLNFYQPFYDNFADLVINKHRIKKRQLMVWGSLFVLYLSSIWFLVMCPFGECESLKVFPKDKANSKYTMFASCLFFVINIICGSGFVEVDLQLKMHKILVIFMIISSRIFMIFTVNTVINMIWIHVGLIMRYESKLEELRDFMRCARVNEFQVRKVLKYLVNLWTYDGGCNFPVLVDKLPSPLVKELKIELYLPLLMKSYLFNGTEELFLKNIAVLLDRSIYYPGNFIVYDCQIDECMYFIKSGQVEILTINTNLTETIHDVLHEMEMFGLAQGLFNRIPHHFTFRARTKVEILTLQLEKWDYLLRYYENSKQIVYKRIRNAHMQLNK